MHTMFGENRENLYYFENHSIGHIEFSGILYIARRHPTKLFEAYPSPYICRYALRRRRDLDFGLHRHIGFWEHLHFIVIFPTLYVLWIWDIGSHASSFWAFGLPFTPFKREIQSKTGNYRSVCSFVLVCLTFFLSYFLPCMYYRYWTLVPMHHYFGTRIHFLPYVR